MKKPAATLQTLSPEKSQATATSHPDEQGLLNRVTTTYVGGNRVHISAGDRSFEADQRTHLDRPGAGFCPLELVAAALGA
jgi:hypothetical protein